jgi:hypothetical protein
MYAALAVVGRAMSITVATNRNGRVDLNNFEMLNIALSPSYDDRESEVAQKVFREPSPDVDLLHKQIEVFWMNYEIYIRRFV